MVGWKNLLGFQCDACGEYNITWCFQGERLAFLARVDGRWKAIKTEKIFYNEYDPEYFDYIDFQISKMKTHYPDYVFIHGWSELYFPEARTCADIVIPLDQYSPLPIPKKSILIIVDQDVKEVFTRKCEYCGVVQDIRFFSIVH